MNLAAFSYDLQGLQIAKTINDPIVGFRTVFENAAETSAEGVELELLWQATDQFRLDTSIAWVDSQFEDFETSDPLDPRNIPGGPPFDPDTNPTGFAPRLIRLDGNPTRNSPELAWNVHAQYDFGALRNGAAFGVAADVSFKDDQFFSEYARSIEGADSYTLVDVSLKYTGVDGRLYGSLWAKNLTDEFEPAGTFALATARQIGVTWLPPRTYGLTLGYRF